jgi:PAS domain S-box-containing protein
MISDMRQAIAGWRATANAEMLSAQAFVYQEMDKQSQSQNWLRVSVFLSYGLFAFFAIGGVDLLSLQRLINRRLREKVGRYRQIFMDGADVAFLLDAQGGMILDANAAAAAFYGWSIDQLCGMNMDDINGLTHAEVDRELALAQAEKRSYCNFRQRLADGSQREVEVRITPVEKDGQRVLYSTVIDCTARRQTERVRALSEERYSAVINSASQGFLMVSPQAGNIIELNEAMCHLLGCERQDVLGKPFYHLAVESERPAIKDMFATASSTRHRSYEVTLLCNSGGKRLTSFHATSLFDDSGVLIGSYAFVEDISKRREAEQRLRDSQSRLQVAIQAGNIGVWTYQPTNDAMTFSAEWKAQLGYKENEFPDSRHRWCEVIHPDDRRISEQAYQDLLNEDMESTVLTERYRHRDGHWVFVRSCALLVRDDKGRPQSVIGAHVDLTPQYEIQESLARANARNALILDSATDGLLGVDELGRVAMVNAACQRLLGFVAKDIIGRNAEDFLHPSRADGTPFAQDDAPISAVLASGMARSAVSALVWRRDGVALPVELGVAPMVWQDSVVGAIVSFHDISEALRYRAELERSNNELEQFAYMASHDLQEPLRTVSSYLTLLRRRYTDVVDDAGREFIGMAVDGANRMSTMIRDLLDYSRVGRLGGELLPTSLNAAMDSALSNLQMTIDDVGATIVYQDDLPMVLADKAQVVSLLQNLIGNAIKYRDKERKPEVKVSAEMLGDDQWRIAISDNGIGIEAAYFERIFVPFQRLHTRDHFEGNGIGLAICRKIVERHGGVLSVESTAGQGSTFSFTMTEAPTGDGDSGAFERV